MMKTFVLLIAFLGFFKILPAQSYKQIEWISIVIKIFDQNSPEKNEVIQDLLSLQSFLVISIQKPIPKENVRNGFLLLSTTSDYIHELLEQKHGIIVCAYQKNLLMGYVLLTDISIFKKFYEDQKLGFVETIIDLAVFDGLLSQEDVGYIGQIGIKPGYFRKGIGTQLINVSKKLKPSGLVADVFLDPVKNQASLHFFLRQGFEKSGILHQYPNINFPYTHQTQVLFWNLHL